MVVHEPGILQHESKHVDFHVFFAEDFGGPPAALGRELFGLEVMGWDVEFGLPYLLGLGGDFGRGAANADKVGKD